MRGVEHVGGQEADQGPVVERHEPPQEVPEREAVLGPSPEHVEGDVEPVLEVGPTSARSLVVGEAGEGGSGRARPPVEGGRRVDSRACQTAITTIAR